MNMRGVLGLMISLVNLSLAVCQQHKNAIDWAFDQRETAEIMAIAKLNESLLLTPAPIRLTTARDNSVCGFRAEPPNHALELHYHSIRQGEYIVTIKSNFSEDGKDSKLKISSIDCHDPPLHSNKRQLHIYFEKPGQPIWTKPFFLINAPIHLNNFAYVANLSDFIRPPINTSICQFTFEEPRTGLFSINSNGTIRVGETGIDVEPGTVNTLRVTAHTCQNPPKSSVPALITISYCSPGWTGISPQIEYTGGDLRPFRGAELRDCSLDEVPTDPEAVKVLPGLTCSLGHLESTARLEVSRSKANTAPHGFTQAHLRECAVQILNNSWVFKLAALSKFDKTPSLNVKTKLPEVFANGKSVNGINFTLAVWIRHSFSDDRIQAIFHAQNLFGGRLSTLLIQKTDKRLSIFAVYKHNPPTQLTWEFPKETRESTEAWHLLTITFALFEEKPAVAVYLDKDELPVVGSGTDGVNDTFQTPGKQEFAFVGAACVPTAFIHHFKGEIAETSLIVGTVLSPSQISCLLDTKPRLIPYTEPSTYLGDSSDLTWDSSLQEIRLLGDQVPQFASILRQIGVEFFDTVFEANLVLESRFRCNDSSEPQALDSLNITLTNALGKNGGKQSAPQADYPCDYQLLLQSNSLQALRGINRPIGISEAKAGQYLIPDAKLTWDASSSSCLARLDKLDANILSCSVRSCDPNHNQLHFGKESIFLNDYSNKTLQDLGLQPEHTAHFFGIVGKAPASTYVSLLKVLAWKHEKATPDIVRCVRFQCRGAVQDSEAEMLLFQRSNTLETWFHIVTNISSDYDDAELVDRSTEPAALDHVQPFPFPLLANEKPQSRSLKFWLPALILTLGLILVVAGFLLIRRASLRRRSYYHHRSGFINKFPTTTSADYVVANDHCEDQVWAGGRKLAESDEDVWVPVLRPKFAGREPRRVEVKPEHRVRFQLTRTMPLMPRSEVLSSSSDSESEEQIDLFNLGGIKHHVGRQNREALSRMSM